MKLLDPRFPFDPRRVPFFYGWVILGASSFGMLMSVPGQTMGVSVFTDPLIEATGLSRLALANAYLLGTLTSGLLLPRGGRLLDRFGARPTVVLSAIGLGLTLLGLSVVDRAADAVAPALPFIEARHVAWLGVALGFVALRFTGQGMLTMVSRTMLGKWFETRRGLTSAVSGVFISFGFAAAPVLLEAWVSTSDWRNAWQGMGLTVMGAMGLVGWLLFRDNPEECGLRMDGQSAEEEARTPRRVEPRTTLAEASKTAAFWAVTLALAVQGTVITGITFHIVDLGSEAGLSRAEAVGIFLPMAVASTLTAIAIGWIADRVRIRTLIFVMCGAQLLGYGSTTLLAEPTGFVLAVIGLGVAGGFFGPLSAVALPRLFGRLHLGAISGAQTMWMVAGSALGPAALALSRDHTGSYHPGLFIALALPIAVAILNTVARHPADEPTLPWRR